MGFEVNLNEVDLQSVGQSNFAKPGWYHFRIDNAQEVGTTPDYLEISCVIVGTVPGNESEIGRKVKERLYDNKAFPKVAAAILVATGIHTIADLTAIKEAGKNPVLELEMLLGRSFIGHYKEEEYEKSNGSGKSKITKIGFGWYHPESEAAKTAKVTLNEAVLAASNAGEFDAFA